VIDVGSVTPIHSIGASFLQAVQSWILLPKRVELWLSEDGVRWRSVTAATHDIPTERDERFRHTFELALPGRGARARYVKVAARSYGTLPDWHAGAGRPAWIFADEIVVR
jgi:hexosaminidase